MEILVLVFVWSFFYFLPSIVGRNKHNAGAIFVLNLLAGWTLVGWIVAMVWACAQDPVGPPIMIQQAPQLSAPSALLCTTCGKYSAAGSRFCSTCGQPLGPTYSRSNLLGNPQSS